MYNYRFECYKDDTEKWIVTIYCNNDPIFMSSNLESKLVAETYGRAFISGCELSRGAI